MSLYSPQEHDEYARTGKPPGYADLSLGDALVRHRPRPKVAIALVIGAVAVVVLSVVSAVDAGYHRESGRLMMPQHHQGHIYLHILGDPPELGILIALAMLIAAGYIGIQRRGIRITSMVAAGVAAVLVALVCFGSGLLQGTFGETNRLTVAESSGYKVVRYNRPRGFFGADDVVLRLRTRDGLMSYESDTDVACFIADSSGADPEWLFDRASLDTDGTVLITAQSGETWLIRFDPRTLRPANPVDRCTHAPDPSAD